MAAQRMGAPYAVFLEQTAQQLEARDGLTLPEIWNANIGLMREAEIPKEALRYLERMGTCFGCEGDKMQIEYFSLFERELDERISVLSAKQSENSRLISALSALTGVLCIVLFL